MKRSRCDPLEKFSSWLLDHGAELKNLQFVHSSAFGNHAVAKEEIQPGESILTLPRRFIIGPKTSTSESTAFSLLRSAWSTLGLPPSLQAQEQCGHFCVIANLVYERSRGGGSFWAPYIATLPGARQVPSATQMHPHELEGCLKGTELLCQALAVHHDLEVLAEVVVPKLTEYDTEVFPAGWCSLEDLRWAHQCFWSRALRVPSPAGGLEECLVPLVDVLNHRPGALTSFNKLNRAPAEGTSASLSSVAPEPCIQVHCGSRIGAGEQVCLNYGAKGNGELLLYFGFVLPDNPADTVQIPASLIQGHEAEPGSKRQFFRVYADPGGAGDRVCLPPEMLDAARAKCPGGEAELPGPTRDAIAAVYGASAVAEEPDWTSIEAYLNDPAETDGMVGEIGTPLSCANESAALEVVRAAVQSCLDEVEGHLSESAYQTEKYEMVRVYRQGQLRLFYGCLQAVDRLKRLLQSSS